MVGKMVPIDILELANMLPYIAKGTVQMLVKDLKIKINIDYPSGPTLKILYCLLCRWKKGSSAKDLQVALRK